MRRSIEFALWFSLCVAISCMAQQLDLDKRASEEVKPASDSRSFMELFTNLQRGWFQASQKKDKVVLDAVQAPERSFSPRKMSIRAFLGVAVVSFVQRQQETVNCKDYTRDYFIIDLWEVNHGKWQVAARYISLEGKPSYLGQ